MQTAVDVRFTDLLRVLMGPWAACDDDNYPRPEDASGWLRVRGILRIPLSFLTPLLYSTVKEPQ